MQCRARAQAPAPRMMCQPPSHLTAAPVGPRCLGGRVAPMPERRHTQCTEGAGVHTFWVASSIWREKVSTGRPCTISYLQVHGARRDLHMRPGRGESVITSLHTASLFRTRIAHERQASSPSIAGADNWEGEHEALFDPVAPVGRHLLHASIRSRVISHCLAHQACMQPGALGALHSARGHCECPQNRVRTYRHGDDAAVGAADKVMHVVRDRLGCRHGLFRCTYR